MASKKRPNHDIIQQEDLRETEACCTPAGCWHQSKKVFSLHFRATLALIHDDKLRCHFIRLPDIFWRTELQAKKKYCKRRKPSVVWITSSLELKTWKQSRRYARAYPPQNCNMTHYKSVNFCQVLECQAHLPPYWSPAPLLKTLWRRFCLKAQAVGCEAQP